MNEFLIKQYINNITHNDIKDFAASHGITLTKVETDLIYNHVKNDWRTIIYGNPRNILDSVKGQMEPHTYNKIEELYVYFKGKYENYF